MIPINDTSLTNAIHQKIMDLGLDENSPAAKLITRSILAMFGYRHKYYDRVVRLAKEYRAIATGENQGEMIIQYKKSETEQQKKNRVEFTLSSTEGVVNSIETQFDRIFKPNKVLNSYEYDSDETGEKKAKLSSLIDEFTGDGNIDDFLKKNFINLNIIDPNAFILVAARPQDDGITKSEPIIFYSPNVWDYKYRNSALKYVIFGESGDKISTIHAYDTTLTLKAIKANGDTKIDTEKEFKKDEFYTTFTHQGKTVYIGLVENKGYTQVPAIRIGTCLDKETNLKTAVSIIDPALDDFKKLINKASEKALSEQKHLFLQKVQKGVVCGFRDGADMCLRGTMKQSGKTCTTCNGNGIKLLTTSQDQLIIADQNEDGSPTSTKDYASYIEFPFDLVDHQQKLVEQAPTDISRIIFGVDVTKIGEGNNVTATEIDSKVEPLNATLAKQAEQLANVDTFITIQVAINAGQGEGLKVSKKAPKDFKIMSLTQLIELLGKAKTSGTPADVIEKIEVSIREKQNEDNPIKNAVARVRAKFEPFKSIPKELKESYLFGLPDTNRDKILFFYGDKIYRKIQLENPFVFTESETAQERAIDAQIDKIIAEKESQRNQSFSNTITDLEEDLEDE